MKKKIIAAALICGFATPTYADIAPCNRPNISNEERIERSDIIFEGSVIDTSCDCHPVLGKILPSFDCMDVIRVNNVVKGPAETQFTHQDIGSTSLPQEKKLQCAAIVDDYKHKHAGKTRTYYLEKKSNRNLSYGYPYTGSTGEYIEISLSGCHPF